MHAAWREGRRRLAAVVATMLAVTACATPAPAPSAAVGPTPEARPVATTTQHDGVVVTLSLAADRVAAKAMLKVRMDVLNAGLGPVSYQSSGCGPLWLTFDGPPVPLPPEPIPVDPPSGDALALAKWSATTGGRALDPVRVGRAMDLPDAAHIGCTADLGFDEIAPGGTLSVDGGWIAQTTDGAGAPPGSYRATLSFPFAGRVAKQDVGDELAPIVVVTPFTVDGPGQPAISFVGAVDRAIGDGRVRAWAATRLTRETLGGAEIFLTDRGWRFRIHYRPGNTTTVWVDPASGAVTGVELGP
jgi:hypothetical protein